MDTVMGRQLMQAVRHTPGGVALCEEKHRDRRNKRAESKVGLTTVFDPETQSASDNDEDGPGDCKWDPRRDRTYPAEIGVSLFSMDSDIVQPRVASKQYGH